MPLDDSCQIMKNTRRYHCYHGRRRHGNDDYLSLMKRGVAAAAAAEQEGAPTPTPTTTRKVVVDDVVDVVVGARY